MAAGGRKEFLAQLADTARALRERIEAEVTGLDDSPAAIAERRKRALADDGFEYFCRTYFPHYIKSPNSRLHEYLYRRLPEILAAPEGQKDAIAAPRGEAKSTLCSQLFPIWCLARQAKHYILVIMDAYDQAAVMVEAVKTELVANPRLALDYPEICGQGPVWKEALLVTRGAAKVQGLGAGKRLRGLRHGPHRPDLVVLDDIESDELVRSPEQRDKRERWIDMAVMNVGAADDTLDLIYIGTILHYDSVLARKLANPLWRAQKFQALLRWPDRMDLWERWEAILRTDGVSAADGFLAANRAEMERGAEVSWPDVRPIAALMRLRVRVGHGAFDAEYQNDPISSEGAAFGRLTYWAEPVATWLYFGAVDPSLGRLNRGSDPSAILVGGYDRATGVLDVVEALIARRLPDRIIEDVIALQARYGCLRWAVETVQFQEFFAAELLKRSAARRIPVPVVPTKPHADKALRIESLQPHVANGLIRVHAGQAELISQLRHWPKADHDDGPDALEMLWRIALTGAGGMSYTPVAGRAFGGTSAGGGRDRDDDRPPFAARSGLARTRGAW